jgi:hypothetical protein
MWAITDFGQATAPVCVPIFILLGIVALIASFRMGATIKDMSNWKVAKGQLLGCHTITTEHKARSGVVSMKTGETYHVEVRYRYVVAGTEYVGFRFKVGQSAVEVGTRKEGERLSSKFKAVPELDVHYDPKNPEMAVLVRTDTDDSSDPSMSNFWGGIILIVMAVAMFVLFRPYGI